MNKKLPTILSLAFLFFLFHSCATSSKGDMAAKFEYSQEVNQLVQAKCYGCHSTNGKSAKAKNALMWDNVPGMSAADQAHVLEEIIEVTEKRAMPPKGLVEKKPELKLTDKEVATFQKWAKKMTNRVSK